jgi:hypothetical protein
MNNDAPDIIKNNDVVGGTFSSSYHTDSLQDSIE